MFNSLFVKVLNLRNARCILNDYIICNSTINANFYDEKTN